MFSPYFKYIPDSFQTFLRYKLQVMATILTLVKTYFNLIQNYKLLIFHYVQGLQGQSRTVYTVRPHDINDKTLPESLKRSILENCLRYQHYLILHLPVLSPVATLPYPSFSCSVSGSNTNLSFICLFCLRQQHYLILHLPVLAPVATLPYPTFACSVSGVNIYLSFINLSCLRQQYILVLY